MQNIFCIAQATLHIAFSNEFLGNFGSTIDYKQQINVCKPASIQ